MTSRYAPLFLLVLVVGLATWGTLRGNLTEMPSMELRSVDGQHVVLGEQTETPTLVVFWATSCVVCVHEIPALNTLYQTLQPQGFNMVAIAMAYDRPDYVMDALARFDISYPVVLDTDGELARLFGGIAVTPTWFLATADGRIVHRQRGPVDTALIRTRVLESAQLMPPPDRT